MKEAAKISHDNYRDETDKELQREELLQVFGSGLLHLVGQQISLKSEIEERWLDDLRHYNGQYDKETLERIAKANADNERKGSQIFVNMTRAKTNLAEAKLSDMIFPTDERNWGIKPTPVPELAKMADITEPVMLQDGRQAMRPDGQPYTYADLARVNMEEAKKKANSMQSEIEDQLTECNYNAIGRDIIHNGCVIGTGILKGPMVTKRERRSWQEVDDGAGGSLYELTYTLETKPEGWSVDPWNFFPDMSATCWDDVEFVFERHLLTRKKVRELLRRPGFMREKVREVLMSEPRTNSASISRLNDIREINGITQIRQDNRYEIWEYHGPVKTEHLLACDCDVDPADPLQEFDAVVWFCGNIVLKVALNHMDSGDFPYSIWNWEKDETCIFGFGVPYRMRGSQKVMNGSWRMLLDNAGLSTGPQIVVNQEIVSPANGVWELTPRKLWYLKDRKARVEDAFGTFEINSHQPELTAIFEMAHTLADEETNLQNIGARLDQENQPAVMKTLGGTALWMTSQNIMMRLAVKNWDDDITDPFITRMYDWNMQFNPKNDIKGDYEVDARGTSVLLARELQARNLMEFISIVYSNPDFVAMTRKPQLLKELARALQMLESDIMLSDEEIMANEEAAKNSQSQDPEMLKLQMQERIAQYGLQEKQMEAEAMIQAKMLEREIDLTKLAIERDMKVADMQSKYGLDQIRVEWDREKFYQELGIKMRQGEQANYGLGQ